MSDEYQNRDHLLGEIHSDVKNIAGWCKDHKNDDERRFKEINSKLMYGAIAIIIVAFASGVLGQLIGHIKIGI